MVLESIPALAQLTPDERLILAAELWRENAVGETEEPDPAIVSLLQERMAQYEASPESVSTWDEVKARLGKN